MAVPVLTPSSETSRIILPETGSAELVNGGVAFGIYSDKTSKFIFGKLPIRCCRCGNSYLS